MFRSSLFFFLFFFFVLSTRNVFWQSRVCVSNFSAPLFLAAFISFSVLNYNRLDRCRFFAARVHRNACIAITNIWIRRNQGDLYETINVGQVVVNRGSLTLRYKIHDKQ